jgi:hypothetical protein
MRRLIGKQLIFMAQPVYQLSIVNISTVVNGSSILVVASECAFVPIVPSRVKEFHIDLGAVHLSIQNARSFRDVAFHKLS